MAQQTPQRLFTVLGLVAWGDLGPTTIYKSKRGKIVAFAKTYPAKPPSPKQQAQRDKLTAAAQQWQALTNAARNQWELASTRASLCMHGYDLWQHWKLTADDSAIRTLERQTHTSLLPP